MDNPDSPDTFNPPLPPDPPPQYLRSPKLQSLPDTSTASNAPYQRFQQSSAPRQSSQDSLPPLDAPRSRAASRPSQPIKDAVNIAFDQSPSTNQLDPEFIRKLTEQVTEQVIKSLQGVNLGVQTPTSSFHSQQSRFGPSSITSASPPQRSPRLSSADSFSPRSTPTSPRLNRYVSPERASSDAGSQYTGVSQASEESRTSADGYMRTRNTREDNQTSPRATKLDVEGLRRGNTTAPDGSVLSSKDFSRKQSGGAEKPALRKDSKDSEAGFFGGFVRNQPRPAAVAEDIDEATTLEKVWRPLFDKGIPTMRLGQFLRGLAKHIIEEYEPKGSLAITPAALLRFFEETKVTQESYPWATIFGGKMPLNSISMMYRKLLCQHHLIQPQLQLHEQPTVPALTALGFEAFMACLIQAHPDSEFERLTKVVREMPVSNADDCKERFPKELSRRLLPSKPNVQAEQRLISSLNHEPNLIRLERGASAMPPPPTSAPPRQSTAIERERMPYTRSSQSSNAFDDEDLIPPSMPLERERKPYSAKEGTGKRYDTDADHHERDLERNHTQSSREPGRPSASKPRPEYSTNSSRTNSSVPPQAIYSKSGPTDSINVPLSNTRSRQNIGPPPLPSNVSYSKSGRRSPTPGQRGAFARSEPLDISSIPQSQYASNLHSPPARDRFPGEAQDEASRYSSRRPPDRSLYANEDDLSGRPIPMRNGPPLQNGYDSGFNVGSGPPANHSTGRVTDERRRSMYTTMGTGGPGSDGYGSYAPNGVVYGSSAQY